MQSHMHHIMCCKRPLPKDGLLQVILPSGYIELGIEEEFDVNMNLLAFTADDTPEVKEATGWVEGTDTPFFSTTGEQKVATPQILEVWTAPPNVLFNGFKVVVYSSTVSPLVLSKAKRALKIH